MSLTDPRPVAPTFAPTDVTGWTAEELAEQDWRDDEVLWHYEAALAAWEARQPNLDLHQAWVAELLEERTLVDVDVVLASCVLTVASLSASVGRSAVRPPAELACLLWRLASAARARRLELADQREVRTAARRP